MANTNRESDPMEVERWVDERLAALSPDPLWQPDTSAGLREVETRRSSHRSRRLRWTGTAMAATIVFVSVPITRAFAARCLEACVAVTTSVGQFWRSDEPAASALRVVGPLVGNIAPDLAGTDSNGAPVHLSALRGRMVVLNFWATWCGPCKVEVPMLNDLQARFAARGVEVIGVSIDDKGWAAINEFVAEQHIGYPVTLADDETTNAFGGVGEIPATFVIDRDGRIIVKRVGVLSEGGVRQIEKLLER